MIVRYQFSIIFLVFVIVFINYLVKRTVQEKMFVERKELDKYDRKIFTITYMFDQQSYGKEFRVFDLSKYLVDKFVNLRKERDAIEISQHKKYSKVAVFDNGHVAEYGTHAELYAKGGIYTEMFNKQAQFYRAQPSEQTGSEDAV